jgi:DNA-binding protein H-NS
MDVTMLTLEEIQAKMLKLQNQADALIAKGAQAALDQIRRIMLEHGLTTEDIEAKAKAKRDAKSTNGIAPKVRGKVAAPEKQPRSPKYLHPKTGATWTGHGRAPAWIAEVKDRSKFLIEASADVALAESASPVSKANTAAKKTSKAVTGASTHRGQRTGPQPAKYLDPKSGATWRGGGRHQPGSLP